jgi:hypothetical protein
MAFWKDCRPIARESAMTRAAGNPTERTYIQFEVRGVTFRESGRFVARCPRLRISATGETPESAQERWQRVFAAYLDSCQRRHTLLKVLNKAGIPYNRVASGREHIEIHEVPEDLEESLNVIPLVFWGSGNDAGGFKTDR